MDRIVFVYKESDIVKVIRPAASFENLFTRVLPEKGGSARRLCPITGASSRCPRLRVAVKERQQPRDQEVEEKGDHVFATINTHGR